MILETIFCWYPLFHNTFTSYFIKPSLENHLGWKSFVRHRYSETGTTTRHRIQQLMLTENIRHADGGMVTPDLSVDILKQRSPVNSKNNTIQHRQILPKRILLTIHRDTSTHRVQSTAPLWVYSEPDVLRMTPHKILCRDGFLSPFVLTRHSVPWHYVNIVS